MRVVGGTLAGVALLAGCSSGSGSGVESVNTLMFTRADGSRITFGGPVRVSCVSGSGDKPPVLRVLVGRRPPSGRRSYWQLEVALADLKRKRTFRFPNDDVAGYAILFAFDAQRRQNELSSSDEEAHGRVVFRRGDCVEGVDVRVEAHLGSELFDLPGAGVRGRFAAS